MPIPTPRPDKEDEVHERNDDLIDPGMGKEQQSYEEYDDPAETVRNAPDEQRSPDEQRKGEHVETP